MDQNEIRSILVTALQKAIESPVDASTLKDGMRLKEDLQLDSVSLIEMVWVIEEKLGIAIPDAEMIGMKTVGDSLQVIEKLVAAKS